MMEKDISSFSSKFIVNRNFFWEFLWRIPSFLKLDMFYPQLFLALCHVKQGLRFHNFQTRRRGPACSQGAKQKNRRSYDRYAARCRRKMWALRDWGARGCWNAENLNNRHSPRNVIGVPLKAFLNVWGDRGGSFWVR